MLLGPGPPPASPDGGCRAVERVAKDVGQARLDAVRPRTKGNGVLRLYLPSRRSRASQWRIASDAPASAWQALLPIATTPPLSRTVVMGGAPMWDSSRARKAAIGDDHGRPSGRPPSRRGPCRISPGDIALGSPRQSRRQLPALGVQALFAVKKMMVFIGSSLQERDAPKASTPHTLLRAGEKAALVGAGAGIKLARRRAPLVRQTPT